VGWPDWRLTSPPDGQRWVRRSPRLSGTDHLRARVSGDIPDGTACLPDSARWAFLIPVEAAYGTPSHRLAAGGKRLRIASPHREWGLFDLTATSPARPVRAGFSVPATVRPQPGRHARPPARRRV
jgi:hypothetical protein